MSNWRFFIDVGGTFTDVVAVSPEGQLRTYKLLSSGVVRGHATVSADGRRITDPARIGDPSDFWLGYTLNPLSDDQVNKSPNHVAAFDSSRGIFNLSHPLCASEVQYELRSHEEAPVVAIRYLMGLRLMDAIDPIEVRLGTTRATNALLERKGARTALVTTQGFADVLKIGYQDRPDLFRLDIRKREEFAAEVIEIDERLSAQGEVIRSPDQGAVQRQLSAALERGVGAIAICLLHSHVNPAHEELVAKLAENAGFQQVSISSRVARIERIVPRGDTTLVDAYLGGTIRGFVAALRKSMPMANIKLMTSSGGLIDADVAGGKDTILSGPAGGVLGCAHVSRRAGFDRVIGFDMGGTSTDVIRIEAPPIDFEYQHETVKAGVRIVTPMFAVETVAAGGGSICGFDGQKLTVGPDSAGANPGPATYGRGGPLTVTDMNLYLGRLSPSHFPFDLDRSIVETKLAVLSETIRAATGTALTPEEMARGFVEIANAHMSAAIRKVSIAKGYDPAEYVLTTFGGAGGQHACAIAENLGIRRVLCSPFAGVLSALGIGTAPVKRICEQSVRHTLDEQSLRLLCHAADSIAAKLRQEIEQEVRSDRPVVATKVTFDVCYVGQSTHLSVFSASANDIRRAFEAQHRQLYGYIHRERDIEIRVLRVEVTSPSHELSSSAGAEFTRRKSSAMSAEGKNDRKRSGTGKDIPLKHHNTDPSLPLFTRRELSSDQVIPGPAIIAEDTSTIVVDPHWFATVLPTGDILLERTNPSAHASLDNRASKTDYSPSPIRLELFNNQFAAIAEQMGATLRRTALSTNVKERLDFSCALFTASGELVVNAPHIPVHLGGMSDCVKCLIEDVKNFRNGDVYITNDPFRGGSHLNDITVITPVFAGQKAWSESRVPTFPLPPGEGLGKGSSFHGHSLESPDFFVASRAHHAEIGGIRPGSMPPESRTLAEEGVLIRTFAWMRNGEARTVELRKLLMESPHPSRNPEDNLADIAAQVAANQTGVNALLELVTRQGFDTVQAYMRHIQAAAENKMRVALRKLPDGIHRFEDRMDDGTTIRLAVTLRDGRATFDFAGTDPIHQGNFNANRAIVSSAVMYCLRCLIDEDIPLNAGVLAPVEIVLPRCFLNPPGHADPQQCPAVAAGNVETSQRIVDTIFGALRMVAASQGTMNNLLMGNARFGYYETICGGAGAGPDFPGADAVHTNMTNTRLTDPETLESHYPVRLVRFQIRRGSGGAGKYHGGCGVIREFEFLEPLDVSLITQRRLTAPYGLNGGQTGLPGKNTFIRAAAHPIENRQSTIGNSEVLPPVASISVLAGDRLIVETPGGGGWGWL